MKSLIFPILALLVGLGVGLGGGLLLSGDSEVDPVADAENNSDEVADASPPPAGSVDPTDPDSFFVIPGQFIVPIVRGDDVDSLVLISVGLSTTPETRLGLVQLEPRLRAVFLDALFDLSSLGGLDGDITAPAWRDSVSMVLHNAALDLIGATVSSVHLLEVSKQSVEG